MECLECVFGFVKQEKSNGDFMLKKQCKNCGNHAGKTFKFEEIGGKNNLNKIPLYDLEKQELFYERQRIANNKKYQSELEEKRKDYYAYLKSEKWKAKRIKVLHRDKYICQACLTNTATDVHHLTYKHIYNEPMFDLVSICRPCHEKLHDLENDV